MSKKSAPKRKPGGDQYRRGYTNGVLAAVDALFDDLAERGDLDDLTYVDHGDGDERSEVCTGCLLAQKGYQHTSYELVLRGRPRPPQRRRVGMSKRYARNPGADQVQAWKRAIAGRNRATRRDRWKRPGPQVVGYVIPAQIRAAAGSVPAMGEEPEPVPAEVADTVRRFTRLVWGDKNLRAAWPLVDDTLRQCWAQQWLYPIRDRARADGFDPEDVVAAFCSAAPDHPLWDPFERSLMRNLAAWGDLDKWPFPENRRRVADDVDLVVLVPTAPPGGSIPPGGFLEGHSVLVRQTRAGWRILNLHSDHVIPEPGWPPRLA